MEKRIVSMTTPMNAIGMTKLASNPNTGDSGLLLSFLRAESSTSIPALNNRKPSMNIGRLIVPQGWDLTAIPNVGKNAATSQPTLPQNICTNTNPKLMRMIG